MKLFKKKESTAVLARRPSLTPSEISAHDSTNGEPAEKTLIDKYVYMCTTSRTYLDVRVVFLLFLVLLCS